MRIASFNIYKDNRTLPVLIDFLAREQFDVVCLQEFPASELGLLERLSGYHQHLADENYDLRRPKNGTVRLKLVILSRFSLERAQVVPHLEHKHTSLRARLTLSSGDISFHYVDVTDGEGRALRIFNCHLELNSNPLVRLAQFREILRYRDGARINIVCGDMNTYATPFWNMLLFWVFGFGREHILLNEPKLFRDVFANEHIQNPFDKLHTIRLLPFQLDYILVPVDVEIKNKKVYQERYGSDHRPVMVEV